jgi:hypothetical protein
LVELGRTGSAVEAWSLALPSRRGRWLTSWMRPSSE